MGTPTVVKARATPPRSGVESLAGVLKVSAFTFTFSTSYATGGEVFDPATTNPNEVKDILGVVVVPPPTGHLFNWDAANKKLMAFWTGTGLNGILAQVAAATNLSVTPGPLTVLVFHR